MDALVEWSERENDPDVGRYQVSGEELQGKLVIPANSINDAVEYLLDLGYVNRTQTLGSHPYKFREVWPETAGRQAYQQSELQPAEEYQLTATDYDVFLSHSSLDDALAADIKKLLEANQIRVFATPGSVPTGSWETQIEEALRTSSTVWVLLTPNALRESVWTHHEFGYFYGYNHVRDRDPQGHSSRFLYTRGTELRGLYAWIQGTQIDSFEDPVPVAETIAKGIGREFHLPSDWVPRVYPQQLAGAFKHPAIGPVSFSSTGLTHRPGTAEARIGIQDIDETIYHVIGLTSHPDVELEAIEEAEVVGPSYSGLVILRLRYRYQRLDDLPEELNDARGRKFNVLPGSRAPEGKAPLLITFETEDGRAMAAVFYYTINDHPKGFPELSLHAPVPMEWRQGVVRSDAD